VLAKMRPRKGALGVDNSRSSARDGLESSRSRALAENGCFAGRARAIRESTLLGAVFRNGNTRIDTGARTSC
jgi:hypothetical protein